MRNGNKQAPKETSKVHIIPSRQGSDHLSTQIDEVEIYLHSKCVMVGGIQVDLSPKEYELLEMLVVNKNIALSRERLIETVWGYEFDGDNRTVDVHIVYLRKKLHLEHRIKTVYKYGYRLEV